MSEPFEGRRGPTVELGCEWYREDGDEDEFDEDAWHANCDKYYDDAAFRKECGPMFPLYDEGGMSESLWGIQMDVDFGSFGTVRGIVKECQDLEIEWRVGPDYDEATSYTTKKSDMDEILRWYFQERFYQSRKDMIQSWAGEDCLAELEQQHKRQQASGGETGAVAIFQGDPGTAEITHLNEIDVYDLDYLEKDYDPDRWDLTMKRLNDPRMAHHYGRKKDAIPTPIVLLVFAMVAHTDSTRLPTIVTKEKEKLYDRVDWMCRYVSGAGGGPVGYAQLAGLEHIVRDIKKKYPAKRAKSDEKVWRDGYLEAQALMLVLSDDFEESVWDWKMCDDLERLSNVVAVFLSTFTTFMSPLLAPTDSARETLSAEHKFNAKHLAAGCFIGIARDDEELNEVYDSFKELLADQSD